MSSLIYGYIVYHSRVCVRKSIEGLQRRKKETVMFASVAKSTIFLCVKERIGEKKGHFSGAFAISSDCEC